MARHCLMPTLCYHLNHQMHSFEPWMVHVLAMNQLSHSFAVVADEQVDNYFYFDHFYFYHLLMDLVHRRPIKMDFRPVQLLLAYSNKVANSNRVELRIKYLFFFRVKLVICGKIQFFMEIINWKIQRKKKIK